MTASEIRSAASVYSQSQIDTSLASKADLVSGVIPTSQIPAIAITEYLGSVSSQVAMLALVGDRGDWCLRSDLGTTWVLSDDDSTLLASWTQLLYPTAPVTSVAGRTGAVTLSHTDISGLGTLATQSGTFSGNSSGTNTGDQDLSSYLTSSTAASTYLPLAGGTLTGDLKFTDATYDIGKTGATRPRDGFFSRDLSVAGTAYATAYYFQNTNLRISAAAAPYTMLFYTAGSVTFQVSSTGTTLLAPSTGSIGFAASSLGATTTTGDTLLFRDGAGIFAQRNSTNAQTFRLYNTYTSSTSFENLQFKANAGAAYQIGSAVGSAGGSNRAIDLGRWDSAGTWQSSLLIDPTNFLVTVGTTQTLLVKTLQLTSTGQIRGDSGNITLSDHSTATTFGLLRFGGTTSSYPAIKRNGVGLEFRLADDSAVAGITAGALTLTQAVATSSSPTAFTLTGAAHTTLALSTEATDVNFNLARTVQFATGALTTQRAMRIQAPTYGFVGASTITTASTLSISGPPIAGTNATITRSFALVAEAGDIAVANTAKLCLDTSGYAWIQGTSASGGGYVVDFYNRYSSNPQIKLSSSALILQAAVGGLVFTTSASVGTIDTGIARNAAATIEINTGTVGTYGDLICRKVTTRNTTTATSIEVTGTYTSSTSYEKVNIKGKASANFEIGPENGSAGGTLRGLTLGGYSAGTTTISPWLTFTSSGNASFSQYATIQGGVLVEAGGSFTTNYAAPAQIRVRRAQGTQGSPTQATNGIQLGIIGAQGLNDGGAYAGYTSYISFNAGENITTTGCGGYFNFYTTPVGSTTEAMRAWIGAAGNFGIGVFAAEPSTLLTINGDMFRLMTAKTPATSGATGNAGEFCWDTTYLYCCTATNTWKRVAWSTF